MKRLLLIAAALLMAAPTLAAADPLTMPQKLQADMTLAHEHHPHGVPTTYQWWAGPFESPPPPATYTSRTTRATATIPDDFDLAHAGVELGAWSTASFDDLNLG